MQPMPPVDKDFSRKVNFCGLETSHGKQRLDLVFPECSQKSSTNF